MPNVKVLVIKDFEDVSSEEGKEIPLNMKYLLKPIHKQKLHDAVSRFVWKLKEERNDVSYLANKEEPQKRKSTELQVTPNSIPLLLEPGLQYKFLIVEDNLINQSVLKNLLKGYTLMIVGDGAAGTLYIVVTYVTKKIRMILMFVCSRG